MKKYNNLSVLLRPNLWTRIFKTDKDLDKKLNVLMDNKEVITHISGCKYKLGNEELWIANYPYAYGSNYSGLKEESLPSRKTVLRLRDYIKKIKEL